MAAVKSLGGAVRGALLFLLVTFMLLLVFLAISSLVSLPGSGDDDTEVSDDDEADTAAPTTTALPNTSTPLLPDDSPPAGPETAVTLQAGEAGGSVTCRPVADGSFAVEVVHPGAEAETYVVAVDLVDPEGERSPRTVTFEPAPAGQAVQLPVAESGDGRFAACVVTAVEHDNRIMITGR